MRISGANVHSNANDNLRDGPGTDPYKFPELDTLVRSCRIERGPIQVQLVQPAGVRFFTSLWWLVKCLVLGSLLGVGTGLALLALLLLWA